VLCEPVEFSQNLDILPISVGLGQDIDGLFVTLLNPLDVFFIQTKFPVVSLLLLGQP